MIAKFDCGPGVWMLGEGFLSDEFRACAGAQAAFGRRDGHR
ncbi:hypothetical protein [Bradyrhizobium sp. RDT46]